MSVLIPVLKRTKLLSESNWDGWNEGDKILYDCPSKNVRSWKCYNYNFEGKNLILVFQSFGDLAAWLRLIHFVIRSILQIYASLVLRV